MEVARANNGDTDTTPLLRNEHQSQRTNEDDTAPTPGYWPLRYRILIWVAAISVLWFWSIFCLFAMLTTALGVGPIRSGGPRCNDNSGLNVGAWYVAFVLIFAVIVGLPGWLGLMRMFETLYPRCRGETEDDWRLRRMNHRMSTLFVTFGFWGVSFGGWALIMDAVCSKS